MAKYQLAVFIGRFQPFHRGHLNVVRSALTIAERVLVLIGSANRARSLRQPWTFAERSAMLQASLSPIELDRVECAPLGDYLYNEAQWLAEVQAAVAEHSQATDKIVLIGHGKDETSYYLHSFPQWALENCLADPQTLNATDIRQFYFARRNTILDLSPLRESLPDGVIELLQSFRRSEHYQTLVDEFEFLQTYRQQWAASPYPPVFVTTDAVVVLRGHVLLVRRRAQPGKGLWALPGGFIQYNQRLEDSMLRELREETRLKVPLPVLRGAIVAREVFDHPERSQRGRTITHAFLLHLDGRHHEDGLPRVRGSDDAEKAHWVPLAELRGMQNQLFEDHFDIITHLLGQI